MTRCHRLRPKKVKERVNKWREETANQIPEDEEASDERPQSLPDDITSAFSQLQIESQHKMAANNSSGRAQH